MEPVFRLKRAANEVDDETCLICQTDNTDRLIKAGLQGIATAKDCARNRLKLNDTINRDSIDRIQSFLGNTAVWHKGCYSSFTSQSKISRLKTDQQNIKNGITIDLRSSVKPIDWKFCIFCQEFKEEQLHSVQSFNTSIKILGLAKYDRKLNISLANVNDIMAAEGKYHLKCYTKFQRETGDVKVTADKSDLAMGWLCAQLKVSASKGHILTLQEVWEHYSTLCQLAQQEVPHYFISRRSSFKEKLMSLITTLYEFHVLEKSEDHDKGTVLVPTAFSHIPIATILSNDDNDDDDDDASIPVYKAGDDLFLSLIHVALKLRSDILSQPPYRGAKVTKEAAIDCIPENLYMFLKVLYGGQDQVFDGYSDNEGDDENIGSCDERIVSVAQDIIYGTSHGKMWTPKHVGLGSTLHQATRSKDLVQLFYKAGHTISYKNVLQLDTALAGSTLHSLNPDNGATVPENLVGGEFVHFSTDNIDILDGSLDGKDTFHATQVTAWQHGPPSRSDTLETLQPSQKKLQVPDVLTTNIPPEKIVKAPEPFFEEIKMEWFTPEEQDPHILSALAKDMVFNLRRGDEDSKTSWSQYNQELSMHDPQITTIGFMPIILSPAHEYDTLNTVIQRCKHIANTLGQQFVVITADEQLYSRLMELKWSQDDYSFLIPRLGGLHTSMNFMKAIGQHFEASGLCDLWVESDLLGAKTAERVLSGKDYEKGMRAHKITLQALWEALMPQLLDYLEENNKDLRLKIKQAETETDDLGLLTVFATTQFQDALRSFVAFRGQNPNFAMWFIYIEMVTILLLFTRAYRDGLWDLHLGAFKMMLPFFHRYSHTNYAKWGTIYIAEMHMLPPKVLDEFRKGNFVVKIGKAKFNQVDPDQSQEWLNGTGKKGGGIVGITKNLTALSRWALSFNLRSEISKDTKAMFGIDLQTTATHKEASISRRRDDIEAECRVIQKLSSFGVFSEDSDNKVLRNIATKDQATEEISESLINVRQHGQEKLHTFVQERLLPKDPEQDQKKFNDPIKRNYPPTFVKLYEVKKTQTQKASIKADRSVLQRLVISYAAGRDVDLNDILSHELLPVPLSLAETDGTLRSGPKSLLMDELICNINCPEVYEVPQNSTLVVDGQALVVGLGRPQCSLRKTFGDFSKLFMNAVFRYGNLFERIDVVFDRYDPMSTKGGTRSRRRKNMPVRRLIESDDVPLPHDWQGFLSEPNNKADLANFLSQELISNAPENKVVVTAGGLPQCDAVLCNRTTLDLEQLQSSHEEADTRMILHCCHTDSPTVVVWSRDTDVLLLLMAHCSHINKQICMKAGTSKVPKFIPVNTVIDTWHLEPGDVLSLLSFHAITGTDTTSFLAGHSKRTALPVFMENKELLSGLGREPLTDETLQQCEQFLCKVYNAHEAKTTNEARVFLFKKGIKQELLPPTSDAVKFHLMRANLQSMIWQRSMEPKPIVLPATECGWEIINDHIKPVLLTLPPVPDSCVNLVSCSCTGTCDTRRCGCRKSNMPCAGFCKCNAICRNISN